MKFKIDGKYQQSGKHTFSVDVDAASENYARELVLSNFGGRHNLTRDKISIEKIEQVK